MVFIPANVIVARYRGQGDDKKINKAVHTSITISIICGIILAFIGFFVAPKLLVLMSLAIYLFAISLGYVSFSINDYISPEYMIIIMFPVINVSFFALSM